MRVAALYEINHDGPVAGCDHGRQLRQMFYPALSFAVGEFGEARFAQQVDVLDFDIGETFGGVLQQEIDPARLAVFDLAA